MHNSRNPTYVGKLGVGNSSITDKRTKPNHVGVPTAPNDTGTEFIISVRIATCNGLKPNPTNKGAAIAAGVQTTGSFNHKGKAQPIIISCATGFDRAAQPTAQHIHCPCHLHHSVEEHRPKYHRNRRSYRYDSLNKVSIYGYKEPSK